MTGAARSAMALWIVGPRTAELRDEKAPEPVGDEVRVRALTSLVSSGTEMLIYRGEVGEGEDLGLPTCTGRFPFPVKYGYQVVGEVLDAGPESKFRAGERVFAWHPHQNVFTMSGSSFITELPAGLEPARAAFLNLVEVAVNAHLDVPVRVGDIVVVHGQGTVGSLVAQLALRTAARVIVVDPIPMRRAAALAWGADAAIDPADAVEAILEFSSGRGADVTFEASGAPPALQTAVETTGQEGTIVAISMFGTRPVVLRLGEEFHYGRQRIVSSQVGSVPASLLPRWPAGRRTSVALGLLATDWLVTPRSLDIDFGDATAAYHLIDSDSQNVTSVLLRYP